MQRLSCLPVGTQPGNRGDVLQLFDPHDHEPSRCKPDLYFFDRYDRETLSRDRRSVLDGPETRSWCEDAWLMTAALTQVTERFKFLVAFRPGLMSPTLAAHMAATFQRVSGGRLLLNVVTGGDDVEQQRFGDHLGKQARYERAGEFLHIVRELWRGEPVTFTGTHY